MVCVRPRIKNSTRPMVSPNSLTISSSPTITTPGRASARADPGHGKLGREQLGSDVAVGDVHLDVVPDRELPLGGDGHPRDEERGLGPLVGGDDVGTARVAVDADV